MITYAAFSPIVENVTFDESEFVCYVEMDEVVVQENDRAGVYLRVRMAHADGLVALDQVEGHVFGVLVQEHAAPVWRLLGFPFEKFLVGLVL